MEKFYGIIIILLIITIYQQIKIYIMKKSINEVREKFNQKVSEDTNTIIDVESRDSDIRLLADDMNKQLIELRKLKRRYEQGDREIKNAITNMSHDLRTPLTVINGYLELLEDIDKNEDVESYLKIIKDRTNNLKQLTDELFSYSLITQEENVKKEKIYINKVLEQSLIEFYPVLQQKSIIPKISITENKIIKTGDEKLLKRIFSNIINNAVKYSSGDLEVSLIDDGTIIFSNSADNLNEVQTQKLFDRFYTVQDIHKSTGLGLSIAKELIEKMNGAIGAKYVNGKLFISLNMPD